MIETLPTVPAILLSTVHTLLRDKEFENLADLCAYYGRTYRTEVHTVLPSETAEQVGSGLLPVYATPAVAALMEQTAYQLIDATTVGTRIAIDHVKACLVGEEVHCTAMLIGQNGRQYDFLIEVRDSHGALLAEAEHTRFAIDPERFMAKLQG